MGFEQLPPNLERGVQRFALQLQVSHDQAVLMLIEAGLNIARTPALNGRVKNSAQELIGLFSSPEDCDVMDEVVAIAYEGRRAAASRDIAF